MYLDHFKLREKPFLLNTDPRFLWLGRQHQEALATLCYGIQENKGLLLLTGDIGTGKTTLISALVDRLNDDDNIVVAKLPDPGLNRSEFFFLVARSFGLRRRVRDKETFTEAFHDFLERLCKQGKKALLIIDEAQIMNSGVLEEVRLLSNMECRSTKLLNIFLVGQNEFNQLLLEPHNRAIRERITVSFNLRPLTADETATYIEHRLRVAGAQGAIFTAEAVREIHAFANGSPRQINILCDLALLFGYEESATQIGRVTIAACRERVRIPNVSGSPLPDELFPPPTDSPPKAILYANSNPDLQPEDSTANDEAAVHPKQSSRISLPVLLTLLIVLPSSYLLYAGLKRSRAPETPPVEKTTLLTTAQQARQAAASIAPLPQMPARPPAEPAPVPSPGKTSAQKPSNANPAEAAAEDKPASEVRTSKTADKSTSETPPAAAASRPVPQAAQPQKHEPPEEPGPPFVDSKRQSVAASLPAGQTAADRPSAQTSGTLEATPARRETPRKHATDTPSSEDRTAGVAAPEPPADTRRPPTSEAPDPADIINWLLQEKQRGGTRQTP